MQVQMTQMHPFRIMSTGELSEDEQVYDFFDASDLEATMIQLKIELLEYGTLKTEERINRIVAGIEDLIKEDTLTKFGNTREEKKRDSVTNEIIEMSKDFPSEEDGCDVSFSVETECSQVTKKMEEETVQFLKISSRYHLK
jgi:hypothetical protein